MKPGSLFQPPRLWRHDPLSRRRVTWIELFFDLIFAAAVAQVGTALHANYTPAGLLRYTFLFVLIWLAWSGNTLYCTRFDTDELGQRLFALAQSFIAAVMAANATDTLDSRSSAGFGAAYAGLRVILVMQYLRARRIPETRQLTTRYAAGYGIAALVWIASSVTQAPERYGVWATAIVIDVATPWFASKYGAGAPPGPAHYPERFGLFTIILLGEFVASVMRGIESQEYWSLPAASMAFGSMTFGFFMWWLYFCKARGTAERHLRSRRDAKLFQAWSYAHLPLFLGIGVAGVGLNLLISPHVEGNFPVSGIHILYAAIVAIMIALLAIGVTSSSTTAE
jgi:low temperature requirement protein LtrA